MSYYDFIWKTINMWMPRLSVAPLDTCSHLCLVPPVTVESLNADDNFELANM